VATFLDGHPTPLLLYENSNISPGAFLIEEQARSLPELPVYAGCSNDRLLCRDLAPLARLQVPEPISVTRRGGRIDVSVPPARNERLLILAEMFRSEWVATAGAEASPVVTVSIGPGLLGVELPAGTTDVRLEYQRVPMTIATAVSWFCLAASIAALVVFSSGALPKKVWLLCGPSKIYPD
jgi:hypothetical protein